jgi:stearoyl-CoA desaturase (delta-9 desaturase)
MSESLPRAKAKGKDVPGSKLHITEQPITLSNWHQHVNWLNVTFVLFIPLIGCIFAFWTPLHLYTAIFAVVYYFNAGLGVTAGT